MWSNGGFRSFCGNYEMRKPQCLQGAAGFSISPDGWGCYTLPNHALYHLSYTRIFSFLLLSLWSKMWSNGDFRRSCRRDKVPKRQRLQGVAGFAFSGQCRGCYTLPNVAPYQLGYTRIFNFCHDTTAEGKIKEFPVCGHSCGQSRFCSAFGNRGKSRKRRCHKALRRFYLPRPGCRHGTPKAATLHPDRCFSIIP